MTHYVITQGEYSDYHIRCVFSDKAEAEKYITTYQSSQSYSDQMQIEEYEDSLCPVPYLYKAFIDQDGLLREVSKLDPPQENQNVIYPNQWHWEWLGGTTAIGVVQYGQTEKEAIKITADKYAEIKAVMAGIA